MKPNTWMLVMLTGLVPTLASAQAPREDDMSGSNVPEPTVTGNAATAPSPAGPAMPNIWVPQPAPAAAPVQAPKETPPPPANFMEKPRAAASAGSDADAPESHVVQKGESLWEICERRLGNPWVWPKVWSLNPSIKNPHLIEPGTKIRLTDGTMAVRPGSRSIVPGAQRFTSRGERAAKGSVYLRGYAYVEDQEFLSQGQIVGSPDEHVFLATGETAYVSWTKGELPKDGEILTVYRTLKKDKLGTVITLQATLKVRGVSQEKKLVRVNVLEVQEPLERGALVSPIRRVYDVVTPQIAKADVKATLIASAGVHELMGTDHVVFINAGRAEGVAVGNLARVVRRGDGYEATKPVGMERDRLVMENNEPFASEGIVFPSDSSALPDEVFADLRVLEVREHSAVLLVTRSTKELAVGDLIQIKSGQ